MQSCVYTGTRPYFQQAVTEPIKPIDGGDGKAGHRIHTYGTPSPAPYLFQPLLRRRILGGIGFFENETHPVIRNKKGEYILRTGRIFQNRQTDSHRSVFCEAAEYLRRCAGMSRDECSEVVARMFREFREYLLRYGGLPATVSRTSSLLSV